MNAPFKAGLEDVIAGRSAICQVDGEAGRLYYRGYEIGELAGAVGFEDVTWLLWFGELSSAPEAAAFRERLAGARGLPAPVLALLHGLPGDCHPLDALRTAVSLAASLDPDTRASDREANVRKAIRLMSLVPETVAAWQRMRTGQAPLPARADLGHGAHFLYALTGHPPAPDVARVMDVVLTLHADHELNASTFALRVAVATMPEWPLTGASAGIRALGSRGSATGCTRWTTLGRACCAAWPRRWPRRPDVAGSSRWGPACMPP